MKTPGSELTDRIAKLSPSKRALLESALNEAQGSVSRPERIPRRTDRRSAPLSFAQERLWFLYQMEPESSAYNSPRAIRVTGTLDVEALRTALETIVARHESLRTTFVTLGETPMQRIGDGAAFRMPVVDLGGSRPGQREAEALRIAQEEAGHPFDLAEGPLFRARLLRLAEDEHVLLLNVHHIVSDGWSVGVLFRELAALYGAFQARQPSPLSELRIQYGDFAAWQRERLRGEVLEAHAGYWREHLRNAPELVTLSTDRPRPPVDALRGAFEPISIARDVSERLQALARQEGVTLFMMLLSVFEVLLFRHTRREDVVVGTNVAGRDLVETEDLIGFFINNLALRTDLSGNPTFRELLTRVREVALGAYAHAEMPFEQVVELLGPTRSLSHAPLFQVLFTLQNMPFRPLKLPGLVVTPMPVGSLTTKYDLTLFLHEDGGTLKGSLDYSADLFDAARIRAMAVEFAALLADVVERPEARLGELLQPLAEAERMRRAVAAGERERSNREKLRRMKPKGVRLAR